LVAFGAEFSVAASDDTTSLLSSWELDALELVHTHLVLVGLLFCGFLVGWVGGGGTELSDLGTEVGAFCWFVTSFGWGDGVWGASEGIQLLLEFGDSLGEFLLVTDGETGDVDSASDDSASWVFGVTVDWSDDLSAVEGLESGGVFLDLVFDLTELSWLEVLSDDSDLCAEVLAFWVFWCVTWSVDALDEVHTGLVFSGLLVNGFLVGGGGGGTELSDLGTEVLAFDGFITSFWESDWSLGAFEAIELLDDCLDFVGDFDWVGDGCTDFSDLLSERHAFLALGFTGEWDVGLLAVQCVQTLLVFIDLGLN